MKIIPLTEARKKMQDVVDKVHYKEESVILSKNSKPWVKIQPLDENEKKSLPNN